MYTVVCEEAKAFDNLTDAIAYAATVGKFVTITGDTMELCGVFGVDGVNDGKLPDGSDYTFFKHTDSLKARRGG